MELDAKDKDDKHNVETTQLKKDNDDMFGKVMMFLKKNGMTRFSLLSDEYYKDHGWLSVFLYGREWIEHQAVGEIMGSVKEEIQLSADFEINNRQHYSI